MRRILFTFWLLLSVSFVLAGEEKQYIPKPQPIHSEIAITAFYYPGTEQMAEWDMVQQTLPQIKPLLGWYDEGNPEVIDWQIKWAVEHGISTFFVDWYWNKGEQRLDHWVKGFYQARYRSYLKWAVMWANHNQPGAHSTADFRKVVQFWLDHYFRTPEYYTIEGRPVVQIWESKNIDRDMIAEAAAHGEKLKQGEGLKRALTFCDQMVKEAGLKGIYFIDVYKGPYKKEALEANRAAGFRETCVYGFTRLAYWRHPNRMQYSKNCIPYDLVVDTIEPYWQERWNACPSYPYMPHIPTGWNCQPRTFEKAFIIKDRTPEKFKVVCQKAKNFCQKNGIKRIILGPINEWQEGSYLEPNEEYGFGMYDALREVFGTKPSTGWPANIIPKDVGRGPYDYPAMEIPNRTSWSFDSSTEGWYRQPYGAPTLLTLNGALHFFRTQADKTAMRIRIQPFEAQKFKQCIIRMKLTPNPSRKLSGKERAKLLWGSLTHPIFNKELVIQEQNAVSLPVIPDGQFHEYILPVGDSPNWNGKINELWFDPVNLTDTVVDIDFIKFK